MTQFLENGIGETLGADLVTYKPLALSGDVWYVHSGTGSDAASPRGLERLRPLATLSQALTNAANADIIVLLDGHTETLTGALTISKVVAICGSGSSGGRPTVKFKRNAAAGTLFTISTNFVRIHNVWFEANQQANATARISVGGTDFELEDCYFECGQYDTGPALSIGSGQGNVRIKDTTFISTATSAAAQPESAIKCAGDSPDMEFDGLVLSGGTVGWSNPYAFDATANALTRVRGRSVSLLLGADMKFASGTTGWVFPRTATGGARLVW